MGQRSSHVGPGTLEGPLYFFLNFSLSLLSTFFNIFIFFFCYLRIPASLCSTQICFIHFWKCLIVNISMTFNITIICDHERISTDDGISLELIDKPSLCNCPVFNHSECSQVKTYFRLQHKNRAKHISEDSLLCAVLMVLTSQKHLKKICTTFACIVILK